MADTSEIKPATTEVAEDVENGNNDSGDKADENLNSKETESENVDAIKKFIEEQEREIASKSGTATPCADDNDPEKEAPPTKGADILNITDGDKEAVKDAEGDTIEDKNEKELQEETLAVASSVMDMILSESEAKIAEKKNVKPLTKRNLETVDKGNNSMALSVGSKVEAKDFTELWHTAQITEVDYDEMEVLVHYDDATKRHDEWISVSSPRLRPMGSAPPPEPIPEPPVSLNPVVEITPLPAMIKDEPKVEDKPKLTYAVGERCLARWRDNRRFIATINQDLGNGKYEIIFDDGVRWTCHVNRIHKFKESSGVLNIDTTGLPNTSSTPSPVYGPGPSNADTPKSLPVFNTHLFDPTRDYLGSKSERREMKRKLNIKEIFNIGQKKKKIITPRVKTPRERMPKIVKEKKARVMKTKVKIGTSATASKKDIPDAVASIIGTVTKEACAEETKDIKPEVEKERENEALVETEDLKVDLDDTLDLANSETLSAPESQDMKHEDDPALDEEVRLVKFEKQDDDKHEEVIDRIKEAINKLEDGLNQEVKVEVKEAKSEVKPEIKLEVKPEVKEVVEETVDPQPGVSGTPKEKKKSLSKIKKAKKVRLLQEKKVKKQVEMVKGELEEMKKQVAELRKKMNEDLMKKQKLEQQELQPGEWCCRWLNGQPVGTVSEVEHDVKVDASNRPALPRRSVQVEDTRLPPGWTKHFVRRSLGHSAGKWDVVLMNPDNRRIHTKTEMRHYLEHHPDESLKDYESVLLDFGIHLKLSRRMGWCTTTPDGEQEPPVAPLPTGLLSTTSPLLRRKSKLSLKKSRKERKQKLKIKMNLPQQENVIPAVDDAVAGPSGEIPVGAPTDASVDVPPENLPLEDGCVYVGSLKVQIIENLLRCPAEGCFKNFRNNTLLKMHIKHYHRELRKMLGATPKVLDLAYARTRPSDVEMRRLKLEAEQKTIKVKLPKLPKRITEPKPEVKEAPSQPKPEIATPVKLEEKIPRSLDSPKLRIALSNKSVKRPKVLLPVRRPDPVETIPELQKDESDAEEKLLEHKEEISKTEELDFEAAISTHTVTKPYGEVKRKSDKKKKTFASISKKPASEDEEWFALNNSDVETRSSYPRSGTPDSKLDQKLVSSESNEEPKEPNYMYTETGERIKIVHMKREEIINCHCGFREEDGLMVQCELCLCWQHGLCHNIHKESDVPEKYTCSICLNPRRGRRSQRFLHDQDRLYEGLLPGAKPCESLRRSHELSGNLHRIEDALHALRVKYYVATKKDHPKLYLWAKDWETSELVMTQERLNSDYSDLSIMISSVGKENLPVRTEDVPMDIRTPPSEEPDADRFSQKDSQLGSQSLLSGLLSSPGGASLDLPISTTELERLAKTVQAEQEAQRVTAPQPEAAIENSACRERLLRHIQRCQALIDARLDSIEAQVAELESQDPSFEDDETADYFPRTKQTIQMLMRDLDTMEELGVIT
ncbi:PHD finger protein 20 isoform X2 [Pectinophora gossypiella]|uniref:MBD domain-containing protein n=2 Tax=Pectinophora gossypiella TaxID=13191 RepID=A0A1E1WBB1_PECGO|nr:PHD finger protein 20 isoform X2 [Pectinophora gossypiella]